MDALQYSIAINARVEKVFAYLDEPTNLPEIMPSLIEVRDMQRLSSAGASFWFA